MLESDPTLAMPDSTGATPQREKKPTQLAVVTESCSGCAGSPACIPYCPIPNCMVWVADDDFRGRVEVNPWLCIGDGLCTSKGPEGSFLDGCPWDAIEMVPIERVEAKLGIHFNS